MTRVPDPPREGEAELHVSGELMSLALDGQLDSATQRRFQVHVQTCPACQNRWLQWQHLSHLLEVEPFVGPLPGFVQRVDHRIRRHQEWRERLLGGLILVGGTLSVWTGLLLGLALTIGFWLLSSPDARLEAVRFLAYSGQLAALMFRDVLAVCSTGLGPAWGSALILALGVVLLIVAAFWARLVPMRSARR